MTIYLSFDQLNAEPLRKIVQSLEANSTGNLSRYSNTIVLRAHVLMNLLILISI